jgi:hypothetical protein
MKAVITARRLHPGHTEAFINAWRPTAWHPAVLQMLALRSSTEPEVFTTVALLHAETARLAELRAEWGAAAYERGQRLEPHVAETMLAGYFDVVFDLDGEAAGDHLLVPLTERRLRTGTGAEFVEALAAASRREGRLPHGMTRVMAMANEADPDHVVQFALVATDDPDAFRRSVRAGRERMRESIAPYVESVGVDATFDQVEQITPARVE